MKVHLASNTVRAVVEHNNLPVICQLRDVSRERGRERCSVVRAGRAVWWEHKWVILSVSVGADIAAQRRNCQAQSRHFLTSNWRIQ